MKRPLHKILLISFSVCMAVCAMAQKKRAQILQAKIASGFGSAQNLDGEIFKGRIAFNDNEGIVTVENNGESHSFTPRKAIGFEFHDLELSRHRVFHVLDYTDKEKGNINPAFFEVLGEFKSFAVLAKIDRVEAKPQKGIMPRVPSTMVASDHTKIAYQTETIFIMNDSGEIIPYVELREKEIEGIYFDTRNQRKKYIDKDLLQEYTGTLHPALEVFASDNSLRFNDKEDLIKILAHYKYLLDN